MLRFLTLISLLMLVGCERPVERFVIVGNSWLGAAPMFSAAATHPEMFPAQLKPVMLVSDVSVLRMLSNDAAAGAFVTLDNALGLNTMTQGEYCLAMVLDRSAGADAILSRPGWELDPQAPLHVGLEDSTLARYVLSQWMRAHHVSPAQVTTQALLPTEHLYAWAQNDIDLIVTYQPFVERLKSRGAEVVFDSQNEALTITDVLIVHKQRWSQIAPAIQHLREQTWPEIMQLLATEQSAFWQALQGLTDLGEEELRSGLKAVEFIAAAAQDEALQTLVESEMPKVSEHLIASEVYDEIVMLERCEQVGEGR